MGTDLRREKELAGQISGERTFQVKKKKTAAAKTSGQEHFWLVGGTSRNCKK